MSTPTTPEQADLVVALRKLSVLIRQFAVRSVIGDVGPADWGQLADVLAAVEQLCRRESDPAIIIDQRD